MATYSIDGAKLAALFFAGAYALDANKAWINDLNVFPVPDGDTGTNMTMTLTSAVKELQNQTEQTVAQVAKAISFGSLRGARGNSGVILSQLLRGFCRSIQNQEELDALTIAEAVGRAIETAYKAVMKPKEGTILTVARGMADKWAELAAEEEDIELLMDRVLAYGEEVLEHTPDLLPVLKEAGVVDSGGQGLMVFLKGSFDCLMGRETAKPAEKETAPEERKTVIADETNLGEITFGYCTEFLINLDKPMSEADEEGFKAYLESLGDSIVMVADEGICKVHVHTNDPGLAIQKALTFGGLTNMKIDNMRYEHEEKLIRDASRIAGEQKAKAAQAPEETDVDPSEWKEMGFVATAVGEGIVEIFKSLGVDVVVEGGQTMNPSAGDMLSAIRKIPAKNIFILPNNKNIVLAAQQAKDMTEDRNIFVIPTKTIPEGITAMTSFIPEGSPEENEANMLSAIGTVKSGEVTYAVRNTTINGHEIHEGNIMALGGPDGIYAVGCDLSTVTVEMIDAMMDDDAGLISLYYGSTVEASDAEAVEAELAEKYPDCDIEVLPGGQPVYYYIASVE